jgi:hypothetical protein
VSDRNGRSKSITQGFRVDMESLGKRSFFLGDVSFIPNIFKMYKPTSHKIRRPAVLYCISVTLVKFSLDINLYSK